MGWMFCGVKVGDESVIWVGKAKVANRVGIILG